MKIKLKRRKKIQLPIPQTFGSSLGSNNRLLEDGDTRITEDGDTRILE